MEAALFPLFQPVSDRCSFPVYRRCTVCCPMMYKPHAVVFPQYFRRQHTVICERGDGGGRVPLKIRFLQSPEKEREEKSLVLSEFPFESISISSAATAIPYTRSGYAPLPLN